MNRFGKVTILFSVLLVFTGLAIYLYNLSFGLLLLPVVLWLLTVAAGVFFIGMNLFMNCKNRLEGRDSSVALTFDDGPSEQTERILVIMKKHGIKATFFVVGKNIQGKEVVIKRMAQEGHEIGNHTLNHSGFFPFKKRGEMAEEIERTNRLINEITGKTPELFRPPFGVTNPNVAFAVRKTGMKCTGWSLRSLDTVISNPGRLLKRLKRKTKKGDVVLLHDNREVTLQILDEYILFLIKHT